MSFQTEITWIGISIVYIVCAIGAVILSKYLKDFLTPYRLDEQLTDKDNPALGLATTGYFIGVMIIFLGATVGPSPYDFPAEETSETAATETTTTETASGTPEIPPLGDLAAELGIDLAWAIGGMLLLNLSCLIVDKLVLYRFSTRKEIIEDRNAGTGAVEAGCLIASALVIAGSIHGEGGLDTALVFFGLGQLVLVLFGVFYQFINSYDIHKEIEEDNVAAGVSLGLNMVAIGVAALLGLMTIMSMSGGRRSRR